jgi:CheY-like chemotaxis protein
VKQVLTNLVGNAIKFTDRGGVAVLVHLDRSGGGRKVRFEVRDTGPGIPADKVDQLFRKFSQIDTSSTRRHEGTGLGLALCKELVGLMKGSIACLPMSGTGACFTFSLPIEGEQTAIAATVEAQLGLLRGRKLATVGCRVATRCVLDAYGRAATWTVRHVSSLAEAARLGRVDRVVVDPVGLGAITDQDVAVLTKLLVEPAVGVHVLADPIEAEAFNSRSGTAVAPAIGPAVFAALSNSSARAQFRDAAPQVVAEPTANKRPRVLLAEDNLASRKLAGIMLKSAGYDVEAVEDGGLAVAAAAQRQFDFILMDYHMPGMDGAEATRRIRAIAGYEALPILGMTACTMRETLETCLAAGMTTNVPKPIDWEGLVQTLRAIGLEAAA